MSFSTSAAVAFSPTSSKTSCINSKRGGGRPGRRPAGPGDRAHRRPGGRPDPRHAGRAHHLRGEVRPLGPPGRPGPPALAGGPPGRGRRQALGRGRDLLEHRARGRGLGLRGPRPAAGARHPGHRPGPPRRVPLRLRLGRGHHRAGGHRGPPPGPQRGGRGGRTLRPGPEGFVGHAPQTQPDPLGTPVRPGRVLRGYLGAGLEDVALWHERDISHSSVERVVLPDASLLTCYMLRKTTGLVAGLVVHPERALANLTEGSRGLVFSQSVLLALVAAGLDRDAAYRIVQRDARGGLGRGPGPSLGARGRPRGDPHRRPARRRLRPGPLARHTRRLLAALSELEPGP